MGDDIYAGGYKVGDRLGQGKVVGPEHAQDPKVKKVYVDVNLDAQIDNKDGAIFVKRPSGKEAVAAEVVAIVGKPTVPDVVGPKGHEGAYDQILNAENDFRNFLTQAQENLKQGRFKKTIGQLGVPRSLQGAKESWDQAVAANKNYRLAPYYLDSLQEILQKALKVISNRSEHGVRLKPEAVDLLLWGPELLERIKAEKAANIASQKKDTPGK